MGRKMQITGGLRSTTKDIECLNNIQQEMNVSRGKAIRLAIENLYEEENGDQGKTVEVHFYYDKKLKQKIELLSEKFGVNKTELYRIAIRRFNNANSK